MYNPFDIHPYSNMCAPSRFHYEVFPPPSPPHFHFPPYHEEMNVGEGNPSWRTRNPYGNATSLVPNSNLPFSRSTYQQGSLSYKEFS
jgi:hypothetical protein